MSLENDKKIIKINEFIKNNNINSKKESNDTFKKFLAMYNNDSLNNTDLEDEFDKQDQADEYLFSAYKCEDIKEKIRLAKKAVKIYPKCIDAMNIITECEADLNKRLYQYYNTIKMAKNILLEDNLFDDNNIGDFWGIVETRPYMRTRHCYILTLMELKKYDEAIKECEELLRLCKNDNLGIRYLIIGMYILFNENKKATRLYNKYKDPSPFMAIPMSVMNYRLGDYKKAKDYLIESNNDNENVIPYLKGNIKISSSKKKAIKDSKQIQLFSLEEVYLALEELTYFLNGKDEYFKWIKETEFEIQ